MALPPELTAHYRELLRIYVIMGSGNLADELRRLAGLLVAAGITARQTARMHLEVVAEMISGLGARSSRHVMTRADLLILEVMMHLGEGYRRSYEELAAPAHPATLAGIRPVGWDKRACEARATSLLHPGAAGWRNGLLPR